MQNIQTYLPVIRLVGIKARTNNAAELDPATAKIGITIQKYFEMGISEKIVNRLKPYSTYCVYTDYASDQNGDYTYFVGEETDPSAVIPDGMFECLIPAQNYIKFTNGPGIMPAVCIDIWQKVWSSTQNELGGIRTYLADFEIYDSRAIDPTNTTLDVYVGIKNE